MFYKLGSIFPLMYGQGIGKIEANMVSGGIEAAH
jgi:hypothetical protein